MSDVIDHIGIRVSDLSVSRQMYEAALAELGFVVLTDGEFEGDAYVLFGRGESDDFCLHTVGSEPSRDRVTTGAHIAFRAGDAEAIVRWHDAALRHGGTDNGPPGTRLEYRVTTSQPSFSIRTATTSRPCSTHRRNRIPSNGNAQAGRRPR